MCCRKPLLSMATTPLLSPRALWGPVGACPQGMVSLLVWTWEGVEHLCSEVA